MPAPDAISKLVERFKEHADAYRSGSYNETQLRRELSLLQGAGLVYELYGLTDEEIEIVEGGSVS